MLGRESRLKTNSNQSHTDKMANGDGKESGERSGEPDLLALLKGDLCAEKGAELENQKKDHRRKESPEVKRYESAWTRQQGAAAMTALVRLWKINKCK